MFLSHEEKTISPLESVVSVKEVESDIYLPKMCDWGEYARHYLQQIFYLPKKKLTSWTEIHKECNSVYVMQWWITIFD